MYFGHRVTIAVHCNNVSHHYKRREHYRGHYVGTGGGSGWFLISWYGLCFHCGEFSEEVLGLLLCACVALKQYKTSAATYSMLELYHSAVCFSVLNGNIHFKALLESHVMPRDRNAAFVASLSQKWLFKPFQNVSGAAALLSHCVPSACSVNILFFSSRLDPFIQAWFSSKGV